MAKWFIELAGKDDPGKEDLSLFVDEVVQFLAYHVSGDASDRLWGGDSTLRALAQETFAADVKPAAEELKTAIRDISLIALKRHGLVGRPARFKYNVIARASSRWRKWRRRLSVGRGFRRVAEAIDAHLDSLIAAAGGVGGIIKEFKDALLAIAPDA